MQGGRTSPAKPTILVVFEARHLARPDPVKVLLLESEEPFREQLWVETQGDLAGIDTQTLTWHSRGTAERLPLEPDTQNCIQSVILQAREMPLSYKFLSLGRTLYL